MGRRNAQGDRGQYRVYLRIEENFPGVKTMRPQGTYMIFPDCSEYCKKHGVTIDEIQKKGVEVGVIWQDGRTFLYPDSIRMNAALPHSQAVEAMRRLKEYVFTD